MRFGRRNASMNGVAINRTCGASQHVVFSRQQNGRTAKTFHHATGHNAHHPRVPIVATQDHTASVVLIKSVGHRHGFGFLGHACGQLLTFPVHFIEGDGQRLGTVAVGRTQQLHRRIGFAQSSHRVQARSQAEAHFHRGQLAFVVQIGHPKQSLHARDTALGNVAQPPSRNHSIFFFQRHDVGDGSNGGQRCQIGQEASKVTGQTSMFIAGGQSGTHPCQFPSHHGPANPIKRIPTYSRVHDGHPGQRECARFILKWLVVIGHQQSESQLFGSSGRFQSRDSTVHTHHHAVPRGRDGLEFGHRDAVALGHPIGNVDLDRSFRPELPEHAGQDGGAGDSVGVVIAVDPKGAPLRVVQLRKHGLGHFRDVGQQLWVVHPGQGSLEEIVCGRLILDSPLGEQSAHQRWSFPTVWHP